MRALAKALPLLVVLALTAGANADERAEELFEQGLEAMLAGRYDEACPALRESYDLEPLAGALFTVAECEARWGELATALGHYREYLVRFARMKPEERAKQRGRDEVAAAQVTALQGVVPTLTLHLPASAPADVVVRFDDALLDHANVGNAMPVNPGEHVVTVTRADGAVSTQRVVLEPGNRRELTLQIPAAVVPIEPEPPPKEQAFDTMPLALAAAGVALVGVAVGAGTGIAAAVDKGTIDEHCVGTACDPEGLEAADSAQTLALVSTIGFGVAGAAAVAAAVLWLMAPSDDEAPEAGGPGVAVSWGPSGGHLTFTGRW